MTIENPFVKVICIAVATLCWLVIARTLREERLSRSAMAALIGSFAVFCYIQYLAVRVAVK